MRHNLFHKKNLTSYRKYDQSDYKKLRKFVHGRINSMESFLCVKGNQTLNDHQLRFESEIFTQNKRQYVESIIEKEFVQIRLKFKDFCHKLSKNLLPHEKLQKIIKKKDNSVMNEISQEELFRLFLKKIKQFLNQQSDIQNIENASIKKLEFPESLQSSQRGISIKQIIGTNNGTNDQTEKISSIEVIDLSFKEKQKNSVKSTEFNKQKQTEPQNIKQNTKNFNIREQKFFSYRFIDSFPISCSSTISEVLYKQAREKKFHQFNQFCQKILLERNPIISDIKYLEKERNQETNQYLKLIYNKLTLIDSQLSSLSGHIATGKRESFQIGKQNKKQITEQIDHICEVLKRLDNTYRLHSSLLSCQRPCCKIQKRFPSRSSKAQLLINFKESANKEIHYQTQATSEYFSRYYKQKDFELSKIYSLEKTKTEQMQNLEKKYNKNKQKQKACKKRCKSLYENFDRFA